MYFFSEVLETFQIRAVFQSSIWMLMKLFYVNNKQKITTI